MNKASCPVWAKNPRKNRPMVASAAKMLSVFFG
jgi:hypothetical protein